MERESVGGLTGETVTGRVLAGVEVDDHQLRLAQALFVAGSENRQGIAGPFQGRFSGVKPSCWARLSALERIEPMTKVMMAPQ